MYTTAAGSPLVAAGVAAPVCVSSPPTTVGAELEATTVVKVALTATRALSAASSTDAPIAT